MKKIISEQIPKKDQLKIIQYLTKVNIIKKKIKIKIE